MAGGTTMSGGTTTMHGGTTTTTTTWSSSSGGTMGGMGGMQGGMGGMGGMMASFSTGITLNTQVKADIGAVGTNYKLDFGPGDYKLGDGIFTKAYNDKFKSFSLTDGCCAELF